MSFIGKISDCKYNVDTRTLLIHGWFLGADIERVEIRLGPQKRLGNAEIGLPRDDVYAKHLEYGNPNPGWHFEKKLHEFPITHGMCFEVMIYSEGRIIYELIRRVKVLTLNRGVLEPPIDLPNRVHACPLCHAQFEQFDTFQAGKTTQARRGLCPSCKTLERTRHIWIFFELNQLLNNNIRMLHIAPLPGLMRRLEQKDMDYVTGDLLRPYTDIRLDLTRLPLESNTFDLIYCSNVLEHIPDDAAAISEMYRVMKPNSLAIIQIPRHDGPHTLEDPSVTSPEERERLYGQWDHVRHYGRDSNERLAKPGFCVQQCIMPDDLALSETQIAQFGLSKKEMIFVCLKFASMSPST